MKRVTKVVCLIIGVMLLSSVAGCQKTQPVEADTVRQYSDPIYEKMMTAINAGDYAMFSESLDQTAKEAMDENQFKEFVGKITTNLGEYKSSEFEKADKLDQYTRAFYNASFELDKNPVQFTIVFSDYDGKMLVSGFFASSKKFK